MNWDKVKKVGINVIFSNKNWKEFLEIKEQLLNENITVLKENLSFLHLKYQAEILNNLFMSNAKIFEEDFWQSYILELEKEFLSKISLIIEQPELFLSILQIKDEREKVDWEQVLLLLIAASIEKGSKISIFDTVFEKTLKVEPMTSKKLLSRSGVGKYPRDLKEYLSLDIIRKGYLDSKTAKKIYTDKSGIFVLEMLKELLSNKSIYSRENYQQIMKILLRTKYSTVARYLVLNLPFNLLFYCLDMSDEVCRFIIQNRIQAGEKHEEKISVH